MSACKEAIMKVRKMACLPAALEAILDAAVRADEQHQGEPVALPARKDPTQGWAVPGGVAKADGWNECLDEIAKLGPLYSRPAKGEPVAYLITPPGCAAALIHAVDLTYRSEHAVPLYTHAHPAEIERLRDENRRLHEAGEFLDGVNQGIEDKLRAQLAEAHALLREAYSELAKNAIQDIPAGLMDRIDALSASAEPSAPVELKAPELTEDLREILGRPNFTCHFIAKALRVMGHSIAHKSEDEQAVVIHWLLGIYLKHGPDWRQRAAAELEEASQSLNT